jgi:signal transduction histidine kinase
MAGASDINDTVGADPVRDGAHAGEAAARDELLARMVLAVEDQFRQITAEIHDDSIQAMTAAGMRLQILRDILDSPEQQVRLDELEQTISLALARLRHLITELQPPPLDREGIVDALRSYLANLAAQAGGDYQIESALAGEPPTPTRLIIYRVTQEILRSLGRAGVAAHLALTVVDDTGGFRVRVVFERRGADGAPAVGHSSEDALARTRERVELSGGWLRTTRDPPGESTVEFWIPAVADAAASTA